MRSRWAPVFLLGNFFVFGYTACPRILSKDEWGGRPSKEPTEQMNTPVPFTVIHHGGIKEYCSSQEECAAIVRSYQDYHMDSKGWNDIGYNFLVGEDGNVYEGRGWETVGAHAPTYNTKSIGICIIGDFTDRLPNDEALNAVRSLIDCGVQENKIQEQYQLIGHRQNAASTTVCPGTALFEQIKTWQHWTPDPEKVSGGDNDRGLSPSDDDTASQWPPSRAEAPVPLPELATYSAVTVILKQWMYKLGT